MNCVFLGLWAEFGDFIFYAYRKVGCARSRVTCEGTAQATMFSMYKWVCCVLVKTGVPLALSCKLGPVNG